MDRIWQWAWDRHGPRYWWAVCAISFPAYLPIYLVLSFLVVAFEKSGHYVEAAAVSVIAVLVLIYVAALPRPPTVPPAGAVGSRSRGRSGDSPGEHLRLWAGVVPRAVGEGVTLQRGEVANPLAWIPPIRDDDTEAAGIDPRRTKRFLYSAIARPGNSGGPIVANEGRVVGIVVEHSEAALTSDPDRAPEPKPTERLPTLKAAWSEVVDLVTCASADTTEEPEPPKLPDAAPFYRGIPSCEIRCALKDLNLEHLMVFEDPLAL